MHFGNNMREVSLFVTTTDNMHTKSNITIHSSLSIIVFTNFHDCCRCVLCKFTSDMLLFIGRRRSQKRLEPRPTNFGKQNGIEHRFAVQIYTLAILSLRLCSFFMIFYLLLNIVQMRIDARMLCVDRFW